MTIKEFQELIKSGVVKKQTPNKFRAKDLIEEAEKKKEYLEISIKNIPKENLNANVIIDQCYDILMELIRAKMHKEGYNAGNSHEAEVSYLKVLGFLESEVILMDELRYYRNGTKYYGTKLDLEYAEKMIKFMQKVYIKLKNKLKEEHD